MPSSPRRRLVALLTALTIAGALGGCSNDSATPKKSSPPGESFVGTGSLASLSKEELCMDPESLPRMCFKVTSESRIAPGLHVGEEIEVSATDGTVQDATRFQG